MVIFWCLFIPTFLATWAVLMMSLGDYEFEGTIKFEFRKLEDPNDPIDYYSEENRRQ